jgi:hypothetical protein
MPASLPDPKLVRAPIAGRKSGSGKLNAFRKESARYYTFNKAYGR